MNVPEERKRKSTMSTVYLAVASNEASISQFCSVVVPIYFFYILLMYAFSEKLAQYLLRKDNFSDNRFKVRPFSIISTVFTSCLFAFSTGYFLLFGVFHIAVMFGFALVGYLWIKVNTYCVRVSYTSNSISYHAWNIKKNIQFSDVNKICWESSRHSAGYTMVVYCHNGNKYFFSSRDFIGLVRLKSIFETQSNL